MGLIVIPVVLSEKANRDLLVNRFGILENRQSTTTDSLTGVLKSDNFVAQSGKSDDESGVQQIVDFVADRMKRREALIVKDKGRILCADLEILRSLDVTILSSINTTTKSEGDNVERVVELLEELEKEQDYLGEVTQIREYAEAVLAKEKEALENRKVISLLTALKQEIQQLMEIKETVQQDSVLVGLIEQYTDMLNVVAEEVTTTGVIDLDKIQKEVYQRYLLGNCSTSCSVTVYDFVRKCLG